MLGSSICLRHKLNIPDRCTLRIYRTSSFNMPNLITAVAPFYLKATDTWQVSWPSTSVALLVVRLSCRRLDSVSLCIGCGMVSFGKS